MRKRPFTAQFETHKPVKQVSSFKRLRRMNKNTERQAVLSVDEADLKKLSNLI